MRIFALFVIFGLGVMVLSMIAERLLNVAIELRAVVLVAAGVGLAWAVDFNLWSMWGLHARAGWLAVTLSGLFVGATAYFWHVLLGFLSGLLRKTHDEAAALEKTQQVHGFTTATLSGLTARRPTAKTG